MGRCAVGAPRAGSEGGRAGAAAFQQGFTGHAALRLRSQLQPGQRIIHATFGRGTVVVLRGPPDARVAIIEFDKHGAKELQLNFALPKITLA